MTTDENLPPTPVIFLRTGESKNICREGCGAGEIEFDRYSSGGMAGRFGRFCVMCVRLCVLFVTKNRLVSLGVTKRHNNHFAK